MGSNKRLLRYKILKKISAGGMASVYLAYDSVLGRDVALKKVHPHLLHQSETIQRFSNEAKAIAALSHEHIIKIFDFGEDGEQPFLVMEYIDGITLEELVVRHGPLPNILVAEIARQVISGLICAHKNGIFHRDIKPGNILIDKVGCVQITDFGIAYLVHSESITVTGSFIGSPHYISPEQISGKMIEGNTDVFSLGVTLFRCLTGALPFDADTPHGIMYAILHASVIFPPIQSNPYVSWLVDLIEACLIKDALNRPHAAQVAASLETSCRADSLEMGKHRLTAFLSDPKTARDLENKEIFSCYRGKALDEFKRRRLTVGLRHFEQARLFGPISAVDQRSIERALRLANVQRTAARTGIVICAALVLTLSVTFLIQHTLEKSVSPTLPNTPSIVGNTRSNAAAGAATVNQPPEAGESTRLISVKESASSINSQRDTKVQNTAHDTEPARIRVDADTETNSGNPPIPESMIGFFSLITNPPWVTTYIDAIERGKTPGLSLIPLIAGRHTVRLSKQGFLDYNDSIFIRPSDTTRLRIKLFTNSREAIAR
jgi:serine/threonine protein kinase